MVFWNKKFVGFIIFDDRLYSPLFYSYMYALGNNYGINPTPFKKNIWIVVGPAGFALAFILAKVFSPTPYYTEHVFPPDLYFLLGSTAVIFFITSLQKYILAFLNNFKLLTTCSDFFYRHTFSIYLTHTLAIYLVEVTFFSFFPMEKNFLYGIVKILLVLSVTAVISIPFSKAATLVISLLIKSKATRG